MTAAEIGHPSRVTCEKGEEPEAAEGSVLQVEALRDVQFLFRTVVLVGKEIHHTKSSKKNNTF